MSELDETLSGDHLSSSSGAIAVGDGLIGGRYRIESLLGVGGMGRVYRAADTELDEVVAIKLLQPNLLESSEVLARFRQEVKLARQVTHRNVARIFDIGEHHGQKFMTMELIDGRALVDELAGRGPIPASKALRVFVDICRGVASAHERGIIHRDLKPGNVMIARDGRVVVTDFGLARPSVAAASDLTDGQIVGTPTYMAPEQVAATELGPPADVYALGLVLFEMLTGRPVWRGASPLIVAAMRVSEDAPRLRAVQPEASPALDDLIARCLEREPDARFADAIELLAAVEPLAAGHASSSSSSSSSSASGLGRLGPGPAPRGPERRVAISTFRTLDDSTARTSAGLREDLIDVLSMTPGLRVRHGAGEADADPIAEGQRLGVDVVVSGVVRRRGDSLRVSVRVIGVADGLQLWAGRFERPLAEALALNDEVGEQVARALALAHGPRRGELDDPQAVEIYLELREAQQREYGNSRDAATGELETKLQRAVELAPDHPLILASSLAMRVRRESIFGRFEVDEEVKRKLRQLQASAPQLPTTWYCQAIIQIYAYRQPAAAVVSLRRALALDPGHVDSLGALAFTLSEAGMLDEAKVHAERALWSDPMAVNIRVTLSYAHALRGAFEDAEVLLHELDTPRWREQRSVDAVRLSLWAGRPLWRDEADIVDPDIARAVELMRAIFDRRVDPAVARQGLQHFLDTALPGSRSSAFLRQIGAESMMYLGEEAAAWAWVVEAEQTGLVDALWLARCPLFEPLRQRPEAAALIEAAAARGRPVRAAYEAPLGASSVITA